MALLYRLQQFQRNLTAGPLPQDAWETITAVLTHTEQQLFRRYSSSDQWHCYQVMMMLQTTGHDHPDLLSAALLHDVGKTCVTVSVIDRSFIVLVQWLFPQYVAKWGQGEPVGWKRPFIVKMQHPEWGAQLAAAAGSRPLTVSLIRRHQDKLGEIKTKADQLLHHLQWADDQN